MTDKKAVVIDAGSGSCKTGVAGTNIPSYVFPSVVGRITQPDASGVDKTQSYVGDQAQARRDVLAITYPIERGIVVDWNGMQRIWKHTFTQLKVTPSEQPVLLTDAPLNSNANREKMAQIMFETFATPSVYIGTQAVLSLYSTGNTTGMVVDMGDGVTHAVPIYQGRALPSTSRLNIGGRDLTTYLHKLLTDRGYTIPDDTVVNNIKEKVGDVALDFQKDATTDKSYTLPDGKAITLGVDRFRCPEALFEPTLVGVKSAGIHELAHNSIMKCDPDIRKKIYDYVVLSGGTTEFTGIGERLHKELTALNPTIGPIKINKPPNRRFSTWIGGSALTSLSTFQAMCASKKEYQETGSSIIQTKFN